MRDHSKHVQVNKKQAADIILSHCVFQQETETVPVSDSVGRVLAEDIRSLWDSPNVLTCCMDSIAVHYDDFADGMPDTSSWERGKQWQFANTGVAMPEGFDTAIVVEHAVLSENDTKVSFDALPSARYAGTSAPGSKKRTGDLLLKKGVKITPLLASLIAGGNHTDVKVLRRPVVVFIPTGNELVKAGPAVLPGKNIESNSYMMAGKIASWGGEPVIYDVVPDDKEQLKAALQKAASEADIVVLNAGSSKGNDDWGIEMLEEIGEVLYHQTNHGPGHHSSFGVIGTTPVVGISGPPGGAAFTTDYYLYPAMMKYLGLPTDLRKVKARLAVPLTGVMKVAEKPAVSSIKAEERPMEGGEFYSIRQVTLQIAEDGVLEVTKIASPHAGPVEAEQAGGYYALPSWPGAPVPQVGDLIEIELRP